MFRYLLLTCLIFNASLSAEKEEVSIDEEDNENIGINALKPNDVMPERVHLSQINSSKLEPDINLCSSKTSDAYERCKGQYHEITNGYPDVHKICCALKTLQQCLIPVINEYCGLEAFSNIKSELNGVNEICRFVGSESCPRLDNNEK
jgi:hypothetical protein